MENWVTVISATTSVEVLFRKIIFFFRRKRSSVLFFRWHQNQFSIYYTRNFCSNYFSAKNFFFSVTWSRKRTSVIFFRCHQNQFIIHTELLQIFCLSNFCGTSVIQYFKVYILLFCYEARIPYIFLLCRISTEFTEFPWNSSGISVKPFCLLKCIMFSKQFCLKKSVWIMKQKLRNIQLIFNLKSQNEVLV